MAQAYLTRIAVEGFKSYRERTEIELAPLTILIGPNNSGKSTWIQVLQLLGQTLHQSRSDVPLSNEGSFDFLSLRDLIHGRPSEPTQSGIALEVEWRSIVGERWVHTDWQELAKTSGVAWLTPTGVGVPVICKLRIRLAESDRDRSIRADEVLVEVRREDREWGDGARLSCRRRPGNGWEFEWNGSPVDRIELELDRFFPVLSLNLSETPRESRERAIFEAWRILFGRPSSDLRDILGRFSYLSSARENPPSFFRRLPVAPEEVGVRGELAAQLLQSKQGELVAYPELATGSEFPVRIQPRLLKDAVNKVYEALGLGAEPLQLEELPIGFRVLFGSFPVDQVGRGLWHLLPLVELGLVSDPSRWEDLPLGGIDLAQPGTYQEAHALPTQIALEEPECHLHPKVQSRLGEWYVALAMAARRLLIETHSDHLVRRLRRMIASAGEGSLLEQWLEKNVIIVQVEQREGISTVVSSRLTKVGDIESWPADFMDEAPNEERQIYLAALDKDPPPALPVIASENNGPAIRD